ncbi:MAG: hypothetical protein ABL308_03390 [Oceanicaulis sp.]
MRLILTASVFTLALTACSDRTPNDDPPPAGTTGEFAGVDAESWACNGFEIEVQRMTERAQIRFGGTDYELDRVGEGEPARFEAAGDPELFIEIAGESLTLSRPDMDRDVQCTRR